MELADRHVLLTGASRGIGRATAAAFATSGARVTGVARTPGDLDEALQGIGIGLAADLTDSDHVADLVRRAEDAQGPIDVLVNNAAISHVGWSLDLDPADLDAVLDLNLRAPLQLCRTVLPGMVDRGVGHVVNVSSMAAVFSTPGLAVYGATKAGLDQFTAGLRQDLRGRGVGLTSVHLASVDTTMDDASRAYAPIAALSAGRNDDRLDPDDVAAAIVDAVVRDRRSVRLPRAMAVLPALVEVPRRLGELVFRRAVAPPTT